MTKKLKDMTIQEIFNQFPDKMEQLDKALRQEGLMCMGCAMGQFETLEQGLLAHGKSHKEIENITSSLNTMIYEKD